MRHGLTSLAPTPELRFRLVDEPCERRKGPRGPSFRRTIKEMHPSSPESGAVVTYSRIRDPNAI